MNPEIEKLQKKLKGTTIFLSVWFAVVVISGIVVLAFGYNYAVIVMLFNLAYIYTLYQRDVTVKIIGFWVYVLISGVGSIAAAIVFIVLQLMAAGYFDSRMNTPLSFDFIIELVLLVFYVIFVFVAMKWYRKHCKTSKTIEKLIHISEYNDTPTGSTFNQFNIHDESYSNSEPSLREKYRISQQFV